MNTSFCGSCLAEIVFYFYTRKQELLSRVLAIAILTVRSSVTWVIVIIIIDNRGLNARWCLTPFLLSLPTAAYLGQHGLTPAGLSHTTAQCHLTILGEAVLFCWNHPSFRTPGSLSFCCRSFYRCGRRGATFSVSLSAVGFNLTALEKSKTLQRNLKLKFFPKNLGFLQPYL